MDWSQVVLDTSPRKVEHVAVQGVTQFGVVASLVIVRFSSPRHPGGADVPRWNARNPIDI